MPLSLVGALTALVLWFILIFVVQLGPSGAAAHLLLGAAGALFVRWWALRDSAPSGR